MNDFWIRVVVWFRRGVQLAAKLARRTRLTLLGDIRHMTRAESGERAIALIDGVSLALTVFAFIMAQAAGLVLTERAQGIRASAIVFYLCTFAVPIGALFGMLRARAQFSQEFHKYDRHTIRLTTCVLFASILFVIGVGWLALGGLLPGQFTALPIESVTPYEFQDGKQGVKVRLRLSPEEYGDRLPPNIVLWVRFHSGLQRRWKLGTPSIFLREAEMKPNPTLDSNRSDDFDEVDVVVRGLHPDSAHSVDLRFYPRYDTNNPAVAIREIAEEGKLTVVIKPSP